MAAAPPSDAGRSTETRRERIYDRDRTTAFSDGVFAIAITLLVLTIEVPKVSDPSELPSAIGDLSDSFISYGISFAVIGLLWFRHHGFFGQLSEVDGPLLVLNLAYLALVAFIPFPTNILGEYPAQPISIALYSGTIGLVGLLSMAMWRHARVAGLLNTRGLQTVREISSWGGAVVPAVMALSIVLAYAVDARLALWSYLLIFLGRLAATRGPGARMGGAA